MWYVNRNRQKRKPSTNTRFICTMWYVNDGNVMTFGNEYREFYMYYVVCELL